MDQSNGGHSQTQDQSPATATGNGEQTGSAESDNAKQVLESRSSNDSLNGSPKVQFGAGTKEKDGSVKGVKRLKRSFKDIVLKDVMTTAQEDSSPTSGRKSFGTPPLKPKSILKSTRSEPLLQNSEDNDKQSLSFVNQAYEGDSTEDISHPDPNSTATAKIATTKNSAKFPFLQRSGSSGSNKGFADVVDLLIQRSSIDLGGRDMHPFGRDCSIEGIMQASRPKSHSKNSAFGKLVIWLTMLSVLVGAACGIIFLSETYNLKQREQRLLQASTNSSTQ